MQNNETHGEAVLDLDNEYVCQFVSRRTDSRLRSIGIEKVGDLHLLKFKTLTEARGVGRKTIQEVMMFAAKIKSPLFGRYLAKNENILREVLDIKERLAECAQLTLEAVKNLEHLEYFIDVSFNLMHEKPVKCLPDGQQ